MLECEAWKHAYRIWLWLGVMVGVCGTDTDTVTMKMDMSDGGGGCSTSCRGCVCGVSHTASVAHSRLFPPSSVSSPPPPNFESREKIVFFSTIQDKKNAGSEAIKTAGSAQERARRTASHARAMVKLQKHGMPAGKEGANGGIEGWEMGARHCGGVHRGGRT